MSARAIHPLGEDLRRMAPVWGIVVGTAVVAVFAMRFISMNFLANALTAGKSGCDYSNLYVAAGRKRFETLRTDGAKLRFQAPDLSQPSLGLLAGKKELEAALVDLHKAADLCAVNKEAHYSLATAEWYAGNASAAYYHLGIAQQIEAHPDAAAISLQTALDQDANNREAQRALASVYRDLGRNAEALALVEKGGTEFESTASGKLAAGMVMAAAGRRTEAEKLLREGLLESPTDTTAIRELFVLMGARGAHKEAGDFFFSLGEGGKLPPPDAYHFAAMAYEAAKDLPNQEKALRRGALMSPNVAVFPFELAVNLSKQNKRAAARDELRRALDRDPEYVMRRIKETGVDPGK